MVFMVKQNVNGTKIFINPSGFIEQHFWGDLNAELILEAIKKLHISCKKMEKDNKQILILEDVSEITKYDFLNPKMASVRKSATKAMKDINFERAAIYGPLQIQVIVSTLALVTNKRSKVQVFDNRANAIKWLLNE
jgi:hypothetical protein